MSKELSRFERGARLELNDLKNVAETQMLEVLGQFVDRVIIGTDQADSLARGYILSGFSATEAANVITVTTGVALLPYYHNGAVRYGFCLSAAPATRVIDLSGLGAGTYKIYIRPELIDDSFANRLSLDPLVSPVVERARNVPTRKIESWSLTASTTSPGADWTEIASFVHGGDITDTRELFFEGKNNVAGPSASVWPLVPATEWGTSNDRLANRGTYGVFGFRKFVRAVQQQLEKIMGDSQKWFETPAKNLADKLSRDGTNAVTGNILPDGPSTRNLGATSYEFEHIYVDDVVATTVTSDSVVCDVTAPGHAVGYTNTLQSSNIPKAWGYLATDGAGGFSNEEGFNFSATLTDDNVNGDYITVTYADPMALGTQCAILVNNVTAGGVIAVGSTAQVTSQTQNDFVARFYTPGGSPQTGLNTTADIRMSFVVFAIQ